MQTAHPSKFLPHPYSNMNWFKFKIKFKTKFSKYGHSGHFQFDLNLACINGSPQSSTVQFYIGLTKLKTHKTPLLVKWYNLNTFFFFFFAYNTLLPFPSPPPSSCWKLGVHYKEQNTIIAISVAGNGGEGK